ncbi:YheU family protein [Mariniblastus sp.]|nr:YheU family protein [Mariniblastus sp.]
MKIPHASLSPTALQEIVEEFVTRDGTDHSGIQQRVTDVLLQLDGKIVELHFDSETGTCNIVKASV